MSTVIKVENLSKQYKLGKISTGTLAHDVNRWWHSIRGKEDPYLKIGEENDRTQKGRDEYVWALKDISFSVKEGEVLGVIGKNGAGKSTLLKILSRTTSPTTGSVKIKGRIASLLEVGTGFHPELTGRENMFLNGAILGMTRGEILKKFDEIVDFAGVEKYIDTPVKRYSSGMYVRLAFAVAAYLEPEILIVDEVLAVGDAEFQSKCLGKMKDVSRNEGRTVLFVSHNMAAIQNLCTRGIYMDKGRTIAIGNVEELTIQYLQSSKLSNSTSLSERTDRSGNLAIKFTNVFFENDRGQRLSSLITGQTVKFVLLFEKLIKDTLRNVIIALGIDDAYGNRITNLNNEVTDQIFQTVGNSVHSIEILINNFPLMPGKYAVTIFSSANGEVCDWVQNAFGFEVVSGDFYGTGKLIAHGQGQFLVNHRFKLNMDTSA